LAVGDIQKRWRRYSVAQRCPDAAELSVVDLSRHDDRPPLPGIVEVMAEPRAVRGKSEMDGSVHCLRTTVVAGLAWSAAKEDPMIDAPSATGNEEESALDRAAAKGPLPGIRGQDAMEERGEDDSEAADPDEKAEDAGRRDLPGGIAMR